MKKPSPISVRITELRENKEMNQGQLAEALGVGRTTVTAWESGDNVPSCEAYLKLARLAPDSDKAIWFLEQAGLDEQAILAAAEQILKERGGPAQAGEVIRVPIFRVTRQGREKTSLSTILGAERVPNPGSTVALVLDEKSAGLTFSAGDLVVIEECAKGPQDLQPFWGQVVLVEFAPRHEHPDLRSTWNWPEGFFLGRLRCKCHSALYYIAMLGPFSEPKLGWSADEGQIIVGYWQHPGPPKEPAEGSVREKAQQELAKADARVSQIISRQLGGPFAGGVIMPTPELQEAKRARQEAQNRLTAAEASEIAEAESEAKEQAGNRLRLIDGCKIIGRVINWSSAPGEK